MKNTIPRRPDLLEGFLDKILVGVNKHQQDGPIPNDLLTEVQSAKAGLSSARTAVQLSTGQVKKDKQDLRDAIQSVTDVAQRARAAVISKYGHKDEVLADFSLSTPRKRGKRGVTAAAKVTKANALVARTRARIEKAKLRLSQLEEELAKRQVDADHAALSLPIEPAPVSEPGPSSNGK